MKISRRSFLGTVSATGAAMAFPAGRDVPILRIGVMTDTHINKYPETCSRIKAAWELFRSFRTDAVFNLGDIADRFIEQAYVNYRKTVNAVKAGGAWNPEELYVWAFHDAYDYHGSKDRGIPHRHEAFVEAARLLESPNGEFAVREWKGFPFLVFPQFIDPKDFAAQYEAPIKKAIAEHPGKPVFVLDHIPPKDTVQNSDTHGDRRRRGILERYPQAVVLTGHVHGSIRNETFAWQGAFTVFNFGCLQKWGGGLVGGIHGGFDSYGVGMLEIYPDRIVVRRFNDVRKPDDEEQPWVMPWPFDPASAPYSLKAKRRSPAPAFPAGAKLEISADGKAESELSLRFPEAAGAYLYRIEDEKGFYAETFSQFHLDRQSRGQNDVKIPLARFAERGQCRFSVAPVGFAGQLGKSMSAQAILPPDVQQVKEIVFESSDPMHELKREWASWCKPIEPDAEGFLVMKYGDDVSLRLPEGLFDRFDNKARFRAVADVTVDTPDGVHFSIGLRRKTPQYWFTREKVRSGRGVKVRIVSAIKIIPGTRDLSYWASLADGKFRFDSIRIVRI